jgi:hypothetical protein
VTIQPAWRIPGVGVLYPCIDRVVIVSTASVGFLKKVLPLPILKRGFHSIDILTYHGPHPHLRSRIVAVGAGNEKVWQLLKKHEHRLRRYWITQVELAFDIRNCLLEDVQTRLLTLVARLDKRSHRRRHLYLISKPGARVSSGHLPDLPTTYYENRQSSVSMKCYGRKAKLPGGRFGACMMRLEWTLAGKPALVRHLGGNQIDDLLAADLNSSLACNLRLARVDHVAVGKLFSVRYGRNHAQSVSHGGASPILKQWRDPKYRARRAAFLVLRVLAYRESPKLSEEHALHVCQESPAQIRGYLRGLRAGSKRLTDYHIDRCFKPVRLLPV